jgi:NAD(P)-dependent dehydrogenase (short-subunit alcohol dehydrogenase family)
MTDSGRLTVVTGAAGALGSHVVARLLAGGRRVTAVDLPAAADRLQKLSDDSGDRCVGLPLDVSSPTAWEEGLAHVGREHGAPDSAVLIAGGWNGGKPFHESDEAVWRSMMNANLETAQHSLRALLPGLVSAGRGSVVLIGSRAAVRPWESTHAAAYAASKAGLVALAQAVAAEVLESGVRVNVVLPSTIDTPANRRGMPEAPHDHWVTPDSLAEVIAFLLSDAARDISGAAIPVYGRA